MKKQFMLGLLALACASGANAQYGFAPPVGVAAVVPGSSPATINLTNVPSSNYSYLAGAIWNYNTVDFNRSFTIDYDASFDILYSGGADGICAVFKQNGSLTSIGNPAGYIGYYGGADFLSNSFAIEFDDFDNSTTVNDPNPYYDHIMIAKNGDFTTPNVIAGPVSILPSTATIKDGVFRHYTIEWVCSTNTLNVYVAGNRRISTTTVDYRTLFTNPGAVTWGFTGGVGSSGSNQLVRNVSVRAGEACAQDCSYKPELRNSTAGGATNFSINPNNSGNVLIAGYTWNFGDGTPNVTTTSPNVAHSYSAPGTYSVTVTILGYNTTTGECCSYRYNTRVDVPRDGRQTTRYAAPAGTKTVANDAEVSPNPSTGLVNIAVPGTKVVSAKVFDINGRVVTDLSFEAAGSKQIDLSNLSKGMYILQVADETGAIHKQKLNLQN